MTELQIIRGMLEVVLREIDSLKKIIAPKRRPFTRREFAEVTGYSYSGISKKIRSGEIREVDGRIPACEADRFMT